MSQGNVVVAVVLRDVGRNFDQGEGSGRSGRGGQKMSHTFQHNSISTAHQSAELCLHFSLNHSRI